MVHGEGAGDVCHSALTVYGIDEPYNLEMASSRVLEGSIEIEYRSID